jgi:hypothetical protein
MRMVRDERVTALDPAREAVSAAVVVTRLVLQETTSPASEVLAVELLLPRNLPSKGSLRPV